MHNPPTAAELHKIFSAEEAQMRKALGLDLDSTPLPAKKPKDGLKFRQQAEIALRCSTPTSKVITYHYTEQTISLTQALCHANIKARKHGLHVLWVEAAEIKERPYVVPR